MLDREGSNSIRQPNQINVAEDVIRWFERMLGDVSERLDRLDTSMANLHRGQSNARRPGRREPRLEEHDDYEYGIDMDEGPSMVGDIGRMRNRRGRLEKRVEIILEMK